MDIFVADLHEYGAGIREQIAGDGEAVTEIREVAMNTVAPRITESLYLLRFAGDVAGVAILHVAAGRGPLEVAVEFDAVGRVKVDALHLPAQTLALGQAGHDLEGVAEDHTVGPVLIVSIELGLVRALSHAVEVGEKVNLRARRLRPRLFRLPQQIVNEHFGVDL